MLQKGVFALSFMYVPYNHGLFYRNRWFWLNGTDKKSGLDRKAFPNLVFIFKNPNQ
jgi:hypothetical protein